MCINKRRHDNCLMLYLLNKFIICLLNTLLKSAIFGLSFIVTCIPHILLHFEPFDSVVSDYDRWFFTEFIIRSLYSNGVQNVNGIFGGFNALVMWPSFAIFLFLVMVNCRISIPTSTFVVRKN